MEFAETFKRQLAIEAFGLIFYAARDTRRLGENVRGVKNTSHVAYHNVVIFIFSLGKEEKN